MFECWKSFLNLWGLYKKMDEDPENTLKVLEYERETAPIEYRALYDVLITMCKLKIIANRKNMSVTELVAEILTNYVNEVWKDDRAVQTASDEKTL